MTTHRSIARGIALASLLIAALTARAAEPQVPATAPATTSAAIDVERFDAAVAKLSHDASAERSAAREELAAMGDPIEPLLKSVLKRDDLDPETQAAVEELLERIAVARARGPSLVTFDRTAAPAKDVFDELARQGKVTFGKTVENLLADPARGPIDVQFQRTPFWTALLDACAKSKLAFRGVESDLVLLDPVADGTPPTPLATSGPFIVSIARVETNISKAIAFGGPKPLNAMNTRNIPACRLYLFAWSEPRLKPIHWLIDSIDEYTTDSGPGNMTKPNQPAAFRPGMSGQVNSRNETQLTLGAPPEGARQITALKLTSRFIIQGRLDKLEISEPLTLKNHKAELAGMGVTIRSVNRFADSQYNYELSIQRGSKSPAEWLLVQAILSRYPCKLLDAEGKQLTPRGGSTSWGGASIEISQTFNAPGGKDRPPVKLVWEFPDDLQQLVAPLEFRDVPLP